jgi:hypothetical protein
MNNAGLEALAGSGGTSPAKAYPANVLPPLFIIHYSLFIIHCPLSTIHYIIL